MTAAVSATPSTSNAFEWHPNPGPQARFLSCKADEVLYGGAAGGGKSDALLVAPTRWIEEPRFRALILRRTFPELKKSLFDRAGELYKGIDPKARFNETDKEWEFSTGAKLYFGHAQHDKDIEQYQGAAFQFVGFDELTHFTKKQYLYLFTRSRSSHGIPIRIRATANPGGEGHEWVLERWAPWLDRRDEYKGPRVNSGEVLYFLPGKGPDDPERLLEGGRDEARSLISGWERLSPEEQTSTPRPRSRTFIAAKLSDNPALIRNDPGYADRIRVQDIVTREQLLNGNWLIKPAAGLYFKRAWLKWFDARPAEVIGRVRRWDLASTENGGDWTVGVRMSKLNTGMLVVEDVIRVRMAPAGVEATVKATAEMDGRDVPVWLPQDPGQAGVAQAAAYAKLLQGWPVHFERETGDKITRARPISAQAGAGNLGIVRAPWNDAFIQILEGFPEAEHDDDVDALSGAFSALTNGGSTTDLWLQAYGIGQ